MVRGLRLNDLPDVLILKIFSMLPNFKESVATHLISKQHEDPYKLVRDVTLEYDNEESLVNFMSFAYGSLLSDDYQILEKLHLKLNKNYSASDINFWVQVAVNRSVRKLRFNLYGGTLVLPSCLSTCTTLKSLILRDVYIELVPLWFCLPFLKSLHLFSVVFSRKASIANLLQSSADLEYLVLNQTSFDYWKRVCLSSLKSLHLSSVIFGGDESIATLLKSCAAREDLVITRTRYDAVRLYNINVPTLKSLTINNSIENRTHDEKESHGFWINALGLETLNIKDTVSNFLMLDFMPQVTKANIQVTCDQSEGFLGSLTSIQHLSLCSRTSETPYPSGSVFPYLGHLELCTCSSGWANLLALLLNDAPRLHSLKLKSNHSAPYNDPKNFWEEPAVVPECLLTQLEIFEWTQYENTAQHRKVAAYILANATCLKMATFSTRNRDKDHRMLMKLKKLNRVSGTCQLVLE